VQSTCLAHSIFNTEEHTIMKNAIVKTLVIGAAAILATGCVSTSDFNQHVTSADAAIKAAQQDAAAAKAAAEAAQTAAASASNAANSAQSTANQALQAAQGAQACCDATNEKIDRAFKKSMGK
jgi:Alanine-zipper, major outer membrane lipoprotein